MQWRSRSFWLPAAGVVTLVISGCSSSSAPSATGSGMNPDAAGGGGNDGGTVSVSGTVVEFAASAEAGTEKPLAGVNVCAYMVSPANCVMTDAAGQFNLTGWAKTSKGGITLEKTGYFRSLALFGMGDTGATVSTRLPSEQLSQLYTQVAGGSWPTAGTGFVITTVNTVQMGANGTLAYTPAMGATFAETPKSGKGPVYVNDSEYPDPTLTATSSRGWGGLLNLTPGTIDIAYTLPGKSCIQPSDAWSSMTGGSVKIPVEADTLTTIGVGCQ